MTNPRTWLAVILVVLGLTLQVTLVTGLPFPGGVAPDLVLLVVAALAVRTGPLYGCVTGFCAGLLADIVPPAYHTIGRFALVYCLVGYLVGAAAGEAEDSPLLSFLAVSVAAVGGTLLYTAFGALFDDPRVTWAAVTRVLPLAVLYDVLLSPFVLYVVARLVDWFDPKRAGHLHMNSWRSGRWRNRPSP